MQYSVINYSLHAVHNVPMTFFLKYLKKKPSFFELELSYNT